MAEGFLRFIGFICLLAVMFCVGASFESAGWAQAYSVTIAFFIGALIATAGMCLVGINRRPLDHGGAVKEHIIDEDETPEPYRWKGPGPAPARWTAPDGTVVYRSLFDYMDD